eukprot:jgi/Tetstr1/438832/TSEL_027341.t1
MIDFAYVSSTTPTWGNDPRWCTPAIAATEAEHNKLAADRASSAPVEGVHRYYPFVIDEDHVRLGRSALTAACIFPVLFPVHNSPILAKYCAAHSIVCEARSNAEIHFTSCS